MIINQLNLQALAANYWDSYCEIFPKLVKFDCPTIELSNRLTRTAGYNVSEDNKVILGAKFFTKHSANMMHVILPHELAHQIDFNLNGWFAGRKHHNYDWCAIMVAIGLSPSIYHSMEL